MKTIEIEITVGENFNRACDKAKALSMNKKNVVEFTFNGIKCLVNEDTNLEHLARDYDHARLMEWDTIGYECLEEYTDSMLEEIKTRKAVREEQYNKEIEKQKVIQFNKKNILLSKIKDEKLEVNNIKEWNDWCDVNKDPYGRAIMEHADRWGRLMQIQIANGEDIEQFINESYIEADIEGLSGTMIDASKKALELSWVHGEKLSKISF